MRNEIVIDGTRHVFREDSGGFYPCRKCSLHYLCETDPLCQKIYGGRGIFEIFNKQKEK